MDMEYKSPTEQAIVGGFFFSFPFFMFLIHNYASCKIDFMSINSNIQNHKPIPRRAMVGIYRVHDGVLITLILILGFE